MFSEVALILGKVRLFHTLTLLGIRSFYIILHRFGQTSSPWFFLGFFFLSGASVMQTDREFKTKLWKSF